MNNKKFSDRITRYSVRVTIGLGCIALDSIYSPRKQRWFI